MTGLAPPFTYYGAKIRIAPQIAALLPPHGHYVEPFAGSMAVLLAKRPSAMETVNDLSRDLMTFWRVLRDRSADLERACSLTPHSRAEYDAAQVNADDDLEQARRVWVRLTQGRKGTLSDVGWRYSLGRADAGVSTIAYMNTFLRRMPPVAARLRAVSLECKPALQMVATYGKHPDVLIYADPPYLASTRKDPRGYSLEMGSEPEHAELAVALRAARAAVVLSGYDSPLYGALYEGWDRMEICTQTGNGAGDKSRTEVLWSNRPFQAQARLWEGLTDDC